MNTADAYARFGYTLARTERTLTAVLRSHLAERNTTPETWYTLHLLAMNGARMDRKALIDQLAGSRTLNSDLASQLLVQLAAEELITGKDQIELTDTGTALHQSLDEYIAIPRIRLLEQFDPNDVVTTVRTMHAIAERAAQDLATPTS